MTELCVAQITPWDSKGGIVAYTERLVRSIKLQNTTVRVTRVDARDSKDPLHYARLVEDIPRDADIIHLQFEAGLFGEVGMSGTGAPAMFAQLKCDPRPVVTTLHEVHREHTHLNQVGNRILQIRDSILERLALWVSDAVVVHTREAKSVLEERHRNTHHIREILLPAEENKALLDPKSSKEKLGLSTPVILTFGWVEEKKRIQDVIRVLTSFEDTTYLVVGDPKTKQDEAFDRRLRKLAVDLGVSDRYKRIGYVSESDTIDKIFSAADAVVLPYQRVSVSIAVNDALAYRKPTVTSNLPAFAEIRDDYDCIQTYETPEDLASVLKTVLFDENERERLRHAADDYVEQVNWRQFGEQTVEIYEQLVN